MNSLRLQYTSITLLSGVLKTDTKQYIDIAVNAVKCNGIHSNNVNYREEDIQFNINTLLELCLIIRGNCYNGNMILLDAATVAVCLQQSGTVRSAAQWMVFAVEERRCSAVGRFGHKISAAIAFNYFNYKSIYNINI